MASQDTLAEVVNSTSKGGTDTAQRGADVSH